MNFLYSVNKTLYCDIKRRFVSFCSTRSKVDVNSLIGCKSNLSDVSVNFIKPILFQSIGIRLFNNKRSVSIAISRAYKKSILDIDTNVKKDTLVYENQSGLHEVLGYIIVVQFCMWLTFAYFYLRTVSHLPPEHLNTFLIDLSNSYWRNGVAITFVATGSLVTLFSYMFSKKNVRKMILLKGGQSMYIETFGFFDRGLKHTVALDDLNCMVSRITAKGYVPIKHRGKAIWLNYLVDVKGIFYEPELFDMTAGLQRLF